jgi:hypothetical protein
MSNRESRRLPVVGGRVQCTSDLSVPVDHCRFCVHSTRVVVGGKEVLSPARAYCRLGRNAVEVDMRKVEAVICDDAQGEGFRSMTTIIS